jgi:hypothetical protein
LHHVNDDRRNRDGHHRVHYHAELAVIGVGRARVLMGDLGCGQKGQKDKAHNRDGRQKATPRSAFVAEICLKSCQSTVSAPFNSTGEHVLPIGRLGCKGVAGIF